MKMCSKSAMGWLFSPRHIVVLLLVYCLKGTKTVHHIRLKTFWSFSDFCPSFSYFPSTARSTRASQKRDEGHARADDDWSSRLPSPCLSVMSWKSTLLVDLSLGFCLYAHDSRIVPSARRIWQYRFCELRFCTSADGANVERWLSSLCCCLVATTACLIY